MSTIVLNSNDMKHCSECRYSELEGIELVCTEFGEVIEDDECCCSAFKPRKQNIPDRHKYKCFVGGILYDVFYFRYEEDDLFACTDNETSKGFYIKPKDLVQCTGLKDKTGKLIYEGDIVYKQGAKNYKGEKMLSKITFSSDTASFSYCDENGSHDFRTGTSLKMEIVGNVYENPELLKGD